MIQMAETWGPNGAERRLSGSDAGELVGQIAALTGSGLPLAAGLAAVSQELPHGRLRRSMRDLACALEAGLPLDQAIGEQQTRVPAHVRHLVAVAIRSGRLGDVLTRYSGYAGLGIDLKRRLVLATAYPLVLLAAAIGLFFFAIGFMVAQFESIFKDFGIPLPGLTIFVVRFSNVVRPLSMPILIAVSSVILAVVLARLCLPPATCRNLARQVPLFGPIWAAVRFSEFCHLLALMLEGQLPLPEAIRLTGEGIEDSGMNRSCAALAREVEAGRSFAGAMSRLNRFPRGLSRLLGWAENQMALPELLHLAGALFETQARSRATFAGAVVSVACVILVFSLILIIPALFLPLITLISRLSG
jgi:general secretion pathway protein F